MASVDFVLFLGAVVSFIAVFLFIATDVAYERKSRRELDAYLRRKQPKPTIITIEEASGSEAGTDPNDLGVHASDTGKADLRR